MIESYVFWDTDRIYWTWVVNGKVKAELTLINYVYGKKVRAWKKTGSEISIPINNGSGQLRWRGKTPEANARYFAADVGATYCLTTKEYYDAIKPMESDNGDHGTAKGKSGKSRRRFTKR
jgi:hypothetical protein